MITEIVEIYNADDDKRTFHIAIDKRTPEFRCMTDVVLFMPKLYSLHPENKLLRLFSKTCRVLADKRYECVLDYQVID